MDEKLVQVIKGFLPEGSEVVKIYKVDSDIKVDVKLPGGSGDMTCSLKKNHAGALYLD
ncbi:MAG: hypothetical protein FWE20_00070 [Defluviitaleaceae bacterium]|nr:hypothetical protein [Defluviitaleaceae bacterium]